MDKVNAGARRARYLEAERLYREGYSQKQVGELLDPPVSAARVGQLLRLGAHYGLYAMPEMRRVTARRNANRLTDIEVRAALLSTARLEQAAKLLGITPSAIKKRFGHVRAGVNAERKCLRLQQKVIDDYRVLTEQMGLPPNAGQMPAPLITRIQRRFGSVKKFYAAVGVTPHDRRRGPRKTLPFHDASNPVK